MFQHPKCSKMVPLWYENHILALCWPSEIVSKSMPKRLQNQLYVGYPLGTLKNTIFDVKTSPRRTPKISIFFKNRPKNLAFTVFGPRCLLEASKNLPKAFQEPPKSRSRALKKHPRAPKSRLRSSQEASKSLQEAPDTGGRDAGRTSTKYEAHGNPVPGQTAGGS